MRNIHEIEIENLIEKAKAASDRAYAPYSGFSVGACLKGESGAYYMGSNIENASFAAGICAERVSLTRAVYEGERSFDAIAVVSNTNPPAIPCGMCLQALSEFCDGDMPVICANREGEYKVYAFSELLPYPFKMDNTENVSASENGE